MKRSSILDVDRLRKSTRTFLLAPISLAVIAGCSGPAEEEVKFVTSVDDCAANTSLDIEACEAAYQQALIDAQNTAPRYRYESDCEAEFDVCEDRGGFFIPLMTGYIVAEIIDEVGDAFERKHRYKHSYPAYLYSGSGPNRNKIMTSDGFVIGRPGKDTYKMSTAALKPKPAVTRTMSRGGFGSTASAKSSWGSSKSKSWGG